MRYRSVISMILAVAMLLFCGCSKNDENKPVMKSENYGFNSAMTAYMAAHTKTILESEMKAAGVDLSKSLADQMRSDGQSWQDYLYKKTVENMEYILLYCEAAYRDGYTPDEGITYKANEEVNYLNTLAKNEGITVEEYIEKTYGKGVTYDGVRVCTEMMALCEGYELYLMKSHNVTAGEADTYVTENSRDFLKFDALRYKTSDKASADKLLACKTPAEFVKAVTGMGAELTDKDKNGYPDACEIKRAAVSSDVAGGFASESGRVVGDTTVSENNCEYTVTMILSLPGRDTTPLWDFRIIYLSTESSTDPFGDAKSLIEQWREKEGGETGFSNLAARYSDDPTAYYGGLFSDTAREDMPNADVAEWVCDSAREAGDITAINADGGAYMVYYISGGIPKWQRDAENIIKAKYAEDKIASVEADIRAEFVTDDKLLKKIMK